KRRRSLYPTNLVSILLREADTALTLAARAWDFLAILSEIEKNYSLNDEINPPQPTRANEND
ncbi:hypothetical protein FRB95_011132, partial [Tulasnella sp. JGI-2019a]